MANKDKKNKTSFEEGNKAAEIWSFAEANALFDRAILRSDVNDVYFIGSIAKIEGISRHTFTYLVEKFPVLNTKKEIIYGNIENNLFLGGLTDENVNSAVSIFGLKNNHNWKDKQEITQDIKVKNDVATMTTEELMLRAKATKEVE